MHFEKEEEVLLPVLDRTMSARQFLDEVAFSQVRQLVGLDQLDVGIAAEAFQRLRLRDATIAGYENFMRSVDASFAESEDKKADEITKGKAKRFRGRAGERSR